MGFSEYSPEPDPRCVAACHFAAAAASSARRSTTPCLSSSSCSAAVDTARGSHFSATASAAAAPAAWPVSQHCGISRRNEWLVASHEMCRPATSRPSMSRGTRQVRRGALERWYDFSNKAEEAALREWCVENGIDLSRT